MDDRMTIDDVARRVGMTVRNVRAHQSRGLVPPPELRGRTGYYGPEHIARLQLIKEMQAAGFNLVAIKSLLDAAPPGAGEEVLRFERALMAPWGSEEPQILTADELGAAFDDPAPDLVRRAVELKLVIPTDDGRFAVPMPTLLRAGRELAAIGIPPQNMIEVLDALLRHVRGISNAFTELFLEGVWRPFERDGEPAEDWPRVRRALERLRPLASEALAAAFSKTMEAAVEEAFGREMVRRSGRRAM